MLSKIKQKYLSGCTVAIILGAFICADASSAMAQDNTAPSDSAVVNLIRLLVKQGVIKKKNAAALLQEAESEAAQARGAKHRAAQNVPMPTPMPETATAEAPPSAQASAAPPPAPPGTVRVPYVPEFVKKQIREQVKQEVLAEIKDQNWAQPETIPEWLRRIQWSGDIRFRDEFDLFARNNIDDFIDFAAFNNNGPTDINPDTNPNGIPFLNTRRNRLDQLSIRARLLMKAEVADGVTVGVRLATGSNNGPISTTQILGGGFDKKDFWLDQAYINLQPVKWAGLTLGRMPNPFMHTELVYDDDLNFDGAAASFATGLPWFGDLSFFANGGFFPLEYVSSNFPTIDPIKAADRTKFLAAAQIGLDWKTKDFDWTYAFSYYDFANVRGQLSNPCFVLTSHDACSTDSTHPAFLQKGNTLFLIRNILPDPNNPLDFAQPQFAGLAFSYKLLDFTTNFSMKVFDDYTLLLTGDYVKNTSYNPNQICRYNPLGVPVTNVSPGVDGLGNPVWFDPCTPPPKGVTPAEFQSGSQAWMVKATFGDPLPRHRWEWNLSAGYRYLQPDAVLDAYTDSDFHLGGTNAKGFTVGGSLALFENTWVTGRWMSANQVSGPPLAIDVLQFDLNTAF